MKASLIPLIMAGLLLVRGTAGAQGASAVIDEVLINATNGNHSQIMAILERQLAEAEKQTQSLQSQLDRLGDPKTVNVDSIAMIKEDVQKSAIALKTESEQRTAMSALTGGEVFDNDAFGLITPIGETVTRKDGTVVERNKEKYKMEAAMDAGVQEYKSVREKALLRKQELAEALGDVIEQLGTAEDFATIQKLQAMVVLLRGQMDECNQSIMMARADADMVEKELMNQAKVAIKGKQEASLEENRTEPDPAGVSAATKQKFRDAMTMPKGSLPWGRKGSATNQGSAGAGGASAVP